jgi:phosphomannomutase/phosphomannomutase/phosphoglucomutase
MIPWLLVLEIMGRTGKTLSQLVAERIAAFPASGEINRVLADPQAALRLVEATYFDQASLLDRIDGLSMEFSNWRFNLRSSNTEPVLRLNVESVGDIALMQRRTEELLTLIDASQEGAEVGI